MNWTSELFRSMNLNQIHPKATSRRFHLAAVLLGTVLLGGATTDDASLLEARRHSIEQLGQAELNRLKRNYETYLKLSPERRQQLADLNAALEQDTKDGGHLQKLLEQYNAWLFKLSPFDRDKLLGTADPESGPIWCKSCGGSNRSSNRLEPAED